VSVFPDRVAVGRVAVEGVILRVASVLKARVEEAKKSGKPTVFLGGVCGGESAWREDLKKEFGDSLALIDPYDDDWEAEDNIYDELATMLGADHVVFYKGGKGTKKEKEFLDEARGDDSYRSFDDIEGLKGHLRGISGRRKQAKEGGAYTRATTQVDLPEDLRDEIIAWGRREIPDGDLVEDEKNSMGREDEIHVTVLFGIKDESPEGVAKVATAVAPFEARLGLVTLFRDKKEYDVVKIDVEAPQLHRLHYEIKESVPSDSSFPTYVPHVTVAYVRKGAGDHLLGSEKFRGRTFKADSVTFKGADKKRTRLPLRGK